MNLKKIVAQGQGSPWWPPGNPGNPVPGLQAPAGQGGPRPGHDDIPALSLATISAVSRATGMTSAAARFR
jgi:hypothetical protein